MDDLQLRANASRTIARPQFRELMFQTYYDPETNRQYNGNPFLVDSELTNYEVRAEYYLGGGDGSRWQGSTRKSTSRSKPSPASPTMPSSPASPMLPPRRCTGPSWSCNIPIDLVDMGGFFETKELVLLANYTWTQSEIQVAAGDTTLRLPQRPMRPRPTCSPTACR